ENRIVLERVISGNGFLACRRQQLDHRLWTARASIRDWRKEPGTEDIFARRQFRLLRSWLGTRWTVHIQGAAVRQFYGFEKTHIRTVPRQGSCNPQLCSRLQELWRNPDAAELSDAVRFADIFSSSAVLIDGVDVEIAVRVPRFVLLHRTRDIDFLVG